MFRAVLLSSVALAATLSAAQAQTTPTGNIASTSVELEPIVVTANRTPTPAKAVGSAVTVITGEELERRQIRLVSDALRQVPGVSVSRSGPVGSLTQVRIRGSEANQTLVLIDGIEVNNPVGGSEFNFANLLTQDIERIEVLRGPQSALYGSDAAGGVVNVITRRGQDGKPRISAFGEGGNRGTAAGGASISGAADRVDYLFSVEGLRTEGFSSLSEARGFRERDGYENATAFGKVGVQALDNLRFDFVARATDYRVEDDSSFEFDPVTFSSLLADSRSRTDGESFFGRAQAKLDLMDGRWQHILGVSATDQSYDSRTDQFPVSFPGSFSTSTFEGKKTKFDYQTTYSFTTDALPDTTHVLTFAADHERDEANSTFLTTERVIEDTGLVGQYQLGLWNDLFVTAAVRHDTNDLFGDATTYRLTSAYTVEQTATKFRASYGTGIKNPTVDELYGFFATYRGNADLRPERSRGWDVGVDQPFLDNRALVEATYFNQRIEDLIRGSGRTSINEEGESPIHGVELALTVRPFDGFSVRAAYTWTDAENADGFQLIRRPEHVASLDADYTFLNNRATISAGLVYTGEQDDQDFATFPATTVTLDDFVLVNVRGGYKVTENAEIYARIENLFDEEYEEVLTFGGAGRTGVAGMRVNF